MCKEKEFNFCSSIGEVSVKIKLKRHNPNKFKDSKTGRYYYAYWWISTQYLRLIDIHISDYLRRSRHLKTSKTFNSYEINSKLPTLNEKTYFRNTPYTIV